MFREYFNQHPLYPMMNDLRCPFPRMSNRAAWAQINDSYKEELLHTAEKWHDVPYPLLTATQFMAFVRNGSRVAWEKPYFDRRRKLIAAVMGMCVSGTCDELDQVIDGIWLICEETSWVISAHNGSAHDGMPPISERPLPNPKNPYVDLFAAQTAMILALTDYLVGEKLDEQAPIIRRRIKDEIEQRVLLPFENHDDFWWMGMIRKDLCNWTPWIVSNVMTSAVIMMDDHRRLAALLSRGCAMLDRYLRIIPEDGSCDEGAGYWNMAGGALLDCLELLECITDGQMSFWNNEKIRGILSFPEKVYLSNGWFVNFADCDARPHLDGERLRYAGEKINNQRLYAIGCALEANATEQLSDTPQMLRLLKMLFHPLPKNTNGVEGIPHDTWMEGVQVRILEKDRTLMACKGGHNGENHNHNDVGAFVLYVDGEPQIIDVGNMVYTQKTFSDERYSIWNIRSMYHNVPIIANQEQQAGTAFHATDVTPLSDGMSMDICNAYGTDARVHKAKREFRLDNQNTLFLSDEITLEEKQPVTWVLMLRNAPILNGSSIQSGKASIAVPPQMNIHCEEIQVTDTRMAKNFPGSVWHVTVSPQEISDQYRVRFVIQAI